MERLCVLLLLGVTLILAVPVVNQPAKPTGLSAAVSLKGYDISLSKAQQNAFAMKTWFELHDKHYNSKGFTEWKPSNTGFLIKHRAGAVLDCQSGLANGSKSEMKVAFSCTHVSKKDMRFKTENSNSNAAKIAKSLSSSLSFFGSKSKVKSFSVFGYKFDFVSTRIHGPPTHGGATAMLSQRFSDPRQKAFADKLQVDFRQKYTPIQTKRIIPLDQQQKIDAADRQRRIANDVDDTDYEGEPATGRREDPEQNEVQQASENGWINRVDRGAGAGVEQVVKGRASGAHNKKLLKGSGGVDPLNDVPYPDAGVDREVNERMFDFLKSHPQYRLPEAHYMTADVWKEWMKQNEEMGAVAAQGIGGTDELPSALGEGSEARDVNGVPKAEGMWRKCQGKVPHGWPETAPVKCEMFATTPVGYWGCDWLFEDGTCGKVKFYPTVRWDGLDAYVPSEAARSKEYAPGYNPPNQYHGEDLTGFAK